MKCTTNQNLTFNKINSDKRMSTKEGHIYNRFHARKHYAKKYGIPFDVTLEYVISIAPEKCPILGIPLSWCERTKKATDSSPTIDKIDPKKGYVKGNVIWLSNRANRIKNDGTAIEHFKIFEFISQHEIKNNQNAY